MRRWLLVVALLAGCATPPIDWARRDEARPSFGGPFVAGKLRAAVGDLGPWYAVMLEAADGGCVPRIGVSLRDGRDHSLLFVGASEEGKRRWLWFERSVPPADVRELSLIIDGTNVAFALEYGLHDEDAPR